jgi:TDG/mug DNA glycosylase family protein
VTVGASSPAVRRPTRDELEGSYGRTVPDVIAKGLDVLFVGINPSLYSAAVGYHFGRPGNRFWPALHGSGFTDRLLSPEEGGELLRFGLGITNIVAGATARADQLAPADLREGGAHLAETARRFRPGIVAVLGVTAYRAAFDRPRAAVGAQPDRLAGSDLWVLPNPSGLNAGYQLPALVRAFAELKAAAPDRRG